MNKRISFIVEVALFSALAFVLDLFSFRAWGQGGSISLQMLPIFIISYRWGLAGGLTSGLVFGLIQMLYGYIINPIQGILDYPLAFTLVGLSGIFSMTIYKSIDADNKVRSNSLIAVSTLIGASGRFISHVLSAIIYFASGAPVGQAVWAYAVIYNGSFMVPSYILTIIVLFIMANRYSDIIKPQYLDS